MLLALGPVGPVRKEKHARWDGTEKECGRAHVGEDRGDEPDAAVCQAGDQRDSDDAAEGMEAELAFHTADRRKDEGRASGCLGRDRKERPHPGGWVLSGGVWSCMCEDHNRHERCKRQLGEVERESDRTLPTPKDEHAKDPEQLTEEKPAGASRSKVKFPPPPG